MIDGASGVPTCGLEVVGGGFGPRAWDPGANNTILCPSARVYDLPTGRLSLSSDL